MADSLQLTTEGREEPVQAPETRRTWEAPPLFAAPTSIAGQLAIGQNDDAGHESMRAGHRVRRVR